MAGPTVLLVDDDADSLAVYRTMLAHRGYRVLTAGHGEEALGVVRQEIPALILMDLWMPVMDGWATMRALRADPLTRRIVILALTAHVQGEVGARVLAAGFDGFLAKPIEPRHVVEEVVRRIGAPERG